ncbi:MAG: hypothetical protein V1797_06220 [Pseudomonadota bacterium]
MPEQVILTVPSPWGLALVLGLIARWHHHQPAPAVITLPAPVQIVQERAANDYAGALHQIDRMCRKRGLGPLMKLIPWQYTQAGPVGSALLVTCQYGWRERQGLAAGWRWQISNPRPAWQAEAA